MPVVIRIRGTLKVVGSNGEDLTPTGPKISALLSLLAIRNGELCPRVWLQETLWSDRSPGQAQDSLRHALSKLKKTLGDDSEILEISREGIYLNRKTTLIDVYDQVPEHIRAHHSETILSNLQVRDKKFTNWLNEARQRLGSRKGIENGIKYSVRNRADCINISFLPPVTNGLKTDADNIATALAAQLSVTLQSTGPFVVINSLESESVHAQKADVLVSVQAASLGKSVSLTLTLQSALTNRVLWNVTHTVKSNKKVSESLTIITAHLAVQISAVLAKRSLSGDRDQAASHLLSAIDNIFSPSFDKLDDAEQSLYKAIEIEDKGVYYAWLAYLLSYRYDATDSNVNELKEQANVLADKALTIDCNNPITLSLLTQVYSFVFRDFDRAESLIEPALAMDSGFVLTVDSYALLNFYRGNFETARKAALMAFERSLFSSNRFCFATSLCMIDCLQGRFDSAAKYGEKALAMHPSNAAKIFPPTLRYLSVAHANLGNMTKAVELHHLLRKHEPHLQSDQIGSESYPVPNQSAVSLLKSSFEKIENQREASIDYEGGMPSFLPAVRRNLH